MTNFYVEGRKMVEYRQNQNIVQNSKSLSNFESFGFLNRIYLKNFMNLWSFEVVTSLFDDKFLEKQHFFSFLFIYFVFTKIIKNKQN